MQAAMVQGQVEVLEGAMDETQAGFQELSAQLTQMSQAAVRLGDPLQVSRPICVQHACLAA